MAEYEGNGDFSYTADGSSDFKRDFKQRDGGTSVKSDDENEEGTQVPEKVNEYVRELMAEKMSIDHKYPQAEKLIDAGMFVREIVTLLMTASICMGNAWNGPDEHLRHMFVTFNSLMFAISFILMIKWPLKLN